MSKQTDQLIKAIESYQKKADGITVDYGNTNLTHRRAQQLAENQRKAGKFLKVVSVATTLLKMHENPPFVLKSMETITTGAEIEFLLFDKYPSPRKSDDPEWLVKDKNKRFRMAEKIGIANEVEFMALEILIKKFADNVPVANSFSESAILLKYPGIRNIPGFFPTPRPLIDGMIELAEYEEDMLTWEPGAGFGSIADAVVEVTKDTNKTKITVCEINNQLATILMEKGYNVAANDVFDFQPLSTFDRIMMNPPFEKGQDTEHVKHCYQYLKNEGKLVSIMSVSWTFTNNPKAEAFRIFVGLHEDEQNELKARGEVTIIMAYKRVFIRMNSDGAFKSSFNKTGVSTLTICIEKTE